MDKKELLKQEQELIKQINAEKKKKSDHQKKLASFKYEEAKKPAAKKPAAKKKTSSAKKKSSTSKVKSTAAKKPAAKKSTAKKSTNNKGANRQNMKKHTIVSMDKWYKGYDYDKRREEWHKYSGMNETQLICDACSDDDNWETIQLENGHHICYFCWVKKPVELPKESKNKNNQKPASAPKAAPALTKVQSAPKKPTQGPVPPQPTKIENKPEAKKEETKSPSKVEQVKNQHPALFACISITLGLLLIAVIVILMVGMISNWTFQF